MNKRPDAYLELALKALERVPRFLAGRSLEAYLADDLCQSAVERQLDVAGDALGQVRKLDLDLFARVPEGVDRRVSQRACSRLRHPRPSASVRRGDAQG
jgi:hypothetical protein